MTREKALLKTKSYLTDLLPSEDYDEVEEIIKALSQEQCEDAISRKDLLSRAWFVTGDDFPMEGLEYITKGMVKNMPPVIPQPKTGHWIYDDEHSSWSNLKYKCSCCKREIIIRYEAKDDVYKDYPYCHCGAKMIESEE